MSDKCTCQAFSHNECCCGNYRDSRDEEITRLTAELSRYKQGAEVKNKVKVVKVDSDGLEFDNGVRLYSDHDSDCCEEHYLSLADLTIADFEGLEFDLTSEEFFERVDGYGIALKPLTGHPVRIPGYGYNNGFYSSQLYLVLSDGKGFLKFFDISDCQVISD